ncbi:MAG TPA: SRPBCC domain-containing protein [Paucimonas sp.]|nr:SRPBCC domain-containing protein [Paucimonas sp.]
MTIEFEPVGGRAFQFRARPTTVTWSLRKMGDGTMLTLEQSGFSGPKGWLLCAMMRRGWKTTLDRRGLSQVLDLLVAGRIESLVPRFP